MSEVWDRIQDLAQHIEQQFAESGLQINHADHDYDWHSRVYSSRHYRRAHVHTVDRRDSHKILILHATVFPHYNDPSPIWGFDAVCGPNKITGAFHDFSNGGDPDHAMMQWFAGKSQQYQWQRPRQLPEWAQAIFSENMIAAGNVSAGPELDSICDLAQDSLAYYLDHVGHSQQDVADYHMIQNRYCHYQKQNPHVVNSMVTMGTTENKIRRYMNEIQYPEIY